MMASLSNPDSQVLEPSPRTSAATYWLWVFGAILAVKGLLFWGDHTPMFFLGDSVAYLSTATGDWIPPDRSFFYGWIIRFLAVRTGSLTMLLASQTLASALTALCGVFILRRYLAVSPAGAALMGLICAVEPLQLLYERYVMTEAFSLLIFALFTTLALGYLKHPSVVRIVLVQLAGVVLIGLRVSFLPEVEAATLLVPVLGGLGALTGEVSRNRVRLKSAGHSALRWRRLGVHLGLSCVLFFGLHYGYKRYYAGLIQHELPHATPAYYYENGFHLLAFVAPIVQPCDFPNAAKADAIFQNLAYDLGDPQTRGKQRWVEGGLIAHLKAAYPNPLEANRLAAATAWNAVKRDPRGEFLLALTGFADYWNRDHLRAGMIMDRGGDRELPPDLLLLLHQHFNLAGEGLPHLATVTNRYYFAAWAWYLVLMLWPLPALFVTVVSPRLHRSAVFL
ncbi:MAG: hypothetical protein WCI73_10055, partial [Phycisphaerae bacterium]